MFIRTSFDRCFVMVTSFIIVYLVAKCQFNNRTKNMRKPVLSMPLATNVDTHFFLFVLFTCKVGQKREIPRKPPDHQPASRTACPTCDPNVGPELGSTL